MLGDLHAHDNLPQKLNHNHKITVEPPLLQSNLTPDTIPTPRKGKGPLNVIHSSSTLPPRAHDIHNTAILLLR